MRASLRRSFNVSKESAVDALTAGVDLLREPRNDGLGKAPLRGELPLSLS